MPDVDIRWLIEKLILIVPLLFSLVIHEYAHARTALAFGDPTARNQGRVTLNPLAHLDPIGTLCLIFSGFGWARPVPVDTHRLHPMPLGEIAVSLAGPLSNLMLAVVTGVAMRLWYQFSPAGGSYAQGYVAYLLLYIVTVNVCLCAFNLIPLFPLDGHHVVRELLPVDRAMRFMHWQVQYGSRVLIGIMFGPILLNLATQGRFDFNPLGWFFRNVQFGALWVLGIGT